MNTFLIVHYTYLILLLLIINNACANVDDNDFAEFDGFDDAQKAKLPDSNPNKNHESNKESNLPDEVIAEEEEPPEDEYKESFPDDDEEEATIEDEENDEYSHFNDEDEFIGFDGEKPKSSNSKSSNSRGRSEPKITIAKVPLHLRSNWDSFYLEILMLLGLAVYFANFVIGRGKNQRIAHLWFDKHKNLLESNFALVGDDGKLENENHGLLKESENVYILWCSGRAGMEGMLVELRLLKRQDLVGVISHVLRPTGDHLIVNVTLEEMDTFVFAFGLKKSIAKLAKDMTDITTYCPDKKNVDKLVSSGQFVVHSEMMEVTTFIVRDPKVMAILDKYPDAIDYFHFSDQYSGPKQQDESQTANLPEIKKSLVFSFRFPKENQLTEDGIEAMRPLMQLALYLTQKVQRFRLSKEGKAKAEKNRSKVEEAFLKATHAARAEMAQNMRDEKKRKERERIMSLDDPEKQRKWEEKEQKKQQKKKVPKMKTMKIRPM